MMMFARNSFSALLAVAFTSQVFAAKPLWDQCGGNGYTGDKTCVAGSSCVYYDPGWSYCAPKESTITIVTGATAEDWDQCGGNAYTGPTQCKVNSVCVYDNEDWSMCIPKVADWEQCGGAGYDGSTICMSTSTCVKEDNDWSYCAPLVSQGGVVPTWEQCGGIGYNGPTECEFGSECVFDNEHWSACLVSCTEPGYECNLNSEECVFIDNRRTFGMCQIKKGKQCGGKDYRGWTKCVPGSTCKVINDSYSECVASSTTSPSPIRSPSPAPSGCSKLYGQCGGNGWTGSKCCESGSVCKYSNDWYSQCLAR